MNKFVQINRTINWCHWYIPMATVFIQHKQWVANLGRSCYYQSILWKRFGFLCGASCLRIAIALSSLCSPLVVSTIVSGILFAHFCTVKPISRKSAFYLWRHSWSKKVPVEKETSLSMGGAIIFLALFSENYIFFFFFFFNVGPS